MKQQLLNSTRPPIEFDSDADPGPMPAFLDRNTRGEDTAPPDAEYSALVRECKEIRARKDNDKRRIGEIADRVTTKYGEKNLQGLAEESGWAFATLERRRTTYRVWKTITAPAPKSYALAQELAGHPNLVQFVEKNPNYAKLKKLEARAIVQKAKAALEAANPKPEDKADDGHPTRRPKKANGEPKPKSNDDSSGWLNELVKSVNSVINELNTVMDRCSPEQHASLQNLESRLLLDAFRNGVEKCTRFVEWIDTPSEKAADKLVGEGRVRKTPKPGPAEHRATQQIHLGA